MDLVTVTLGPMTPEALPERGGVVLATTDRDFSAWCWVRAFCASGRGRCERLVLATFNVSPGPLAELFDGMDAGQVGVCDLLLSADVPYAAGQDTAVLLSLAELVHAFPGRFRHAARRTHAKVYCGWMESGDVFAVIGSGNLSAHNARAECYTVLNDPAAGRHLSQWVAEVMT